VTSFEGVSTDDPIELSAIERGAGTPVALVHGGIIHSGPAWARNIGPLAEAEFRVIAVDRRGHGRSPAGEADLVSMYLHANDLRLTLEFREATEAHLVGVSYGALVCLQYALRWPERVLSLALIEPPLFTWLKDDPDLSDWYARFSEIAERRRQLPLEEWLPEWLGLIDSRMASEVKPGSPIWKTVEKQAPLIFKEEAGWQWEVSEEELAALDVPTLVVSGDQSEPAMGLIAEMVASRLPRAAHVWIEGAGHDPHSRNAEAFNGVLIDFLSKHEPKER
jgi:pimeloyl-ACP methyl ester carboxylesterase